MPNDTVSVTSQELDLLIRTKVMETRLAMIENAEKEHQRKEEEIWKDVFSKLEAIESYQHQFPLQMQKHKETIEDDMLETHMTRKEMTAMLRTAVIVGGLAVSAINAAFTFTLLKEVDPHRSEINTRIDMIEYSLYNPKPDKD